MPVAKVHRISAHSPDDMDGLARAVASGEIDPSGVLAVFGKTEGNGLVNDFSRGFATAALTEFFADKIGKDAAKRICFVMSGGTEGAMAPHWTVFERAKSNAASAAKPSLAIGHSHTADLPSQDLGRLAQIDMVAAGIGTAMADAGIARVEDVHFVQVKCPLLTAQRVKAARDAGHTVSTPDTLKSMGLSRAASALGVAVALGELKRSEMTDQDIGSNMALWSKRASCSAGIELLGHEIVVLGMSEHWSGPLAIDHAVMADGIDIEPVRAAMQRLGLDTAKQLKSEGALIAMLAKAEASKTGVLRGYRHTMLDDSDISSTRHARAFVCGALAGIVGHAEIFVSGGAEHQGPDGGGPVAIIVDRGLAAR